MTSITSVPGLEPRRSREAAHWIWRPVPVGVRGTSPPPERNRTIGLVAAGSRIKVTTTGAGSGMVYQRRVSSIRAATTNASNDEGEAVTPVGAGLGEVTGGVHEATATATVNTRARYLKVTWPSWRSGAGSCPKRPGMYRMVSPRL